MSEHFDGIDDYLDAGNPSALNLTDEITVSAWVRLESTSAEGKIIAKWSDDGDDFQYLLSTDGGDMCLFAIYNGDTRIAQGTTSLAVGVWHHLVGTYDGSNVKVYCDGVEEDSTATTGDMSSTPAPFRIGSGSGESGTEDPFPGDIGHCAIWGVSLNAGEIESLSNGISPPKIRSESLLFFAPLNGQNPEYDIIGGLDLIVNGPVVADEPPIPNSIVAP